MGKKLKKIKVVEDANSISKAIVNYIIHEGHWASRVNTTGIFDKSTGAFRKTTQQKGFSDIIAVIFGRAVFIEVKYGEDKMSCNQKKFEKDVTQAHGIYCIVNKYDEFINDTWPVIYNQITDES